MFLIMKNYLTVQCFITDISAIKDRELNSIVEKRKIMKWS